MAINVRRKSLKIVRILNVPVRLLVILFLVLVLFVQPASIVVGYHQSVPPAATSIAFTGEELLGRPTDTSITISIVPDSTIEYHYQYGLHSGSLDLQTETATATGGEPHKMVISELIPNTQYYYRMRYHLQGETDWVVRTEHTFMTQRAENSTFTFTITSDSHVNIMLGNATTWTNTLNDVAESNPDFLIDLGDTFAMDNVTTVPGAETAYKYQLPFFNIISGSAPIFIVPGNHEEQEGWHLDDTGNPATSKPVMGTNAQKKYFPNPIPDGFYTGNIDTYSYLDGDQFREDYYAWEWGDALFVVIDPYWYTMTKPFTGDMGGGETSDTGSGDRWDWTLGQTQYNWLKATLENSNAKYKFVFSHHMTGGSDDYVRGGANPAHLVEWGGYNEAGTVYEWETKRAGWGSDPVHEVFVNNHVSAYFHGHDHQYAYEERDGIVYQSLPSAGFSGSGFNIYFTGSGYTIKALPSPGHLRVTVSPDETTVEYIQTSGTSSVYTYYIEPNEPSVTHVLTTGVSPSGAGTINPVEGEHTYAEGSVINITANSNPGYEFSSWSGDCSGVGTCSVTMNTDMNVTANFIETNTSILGDVNNDGLVNSTDALIILSGDAGINVTQFCPMNCGDVNEDGSVTATDALIVLSYSAGMSVPFPVGEEGCPVVVTPCPGCNP